MSTDKSLKHSKSKDKFLIANVSNYFWKHSGQDNLSYIQQTVQATAMGSAEEPFSEYEKNDKKPIHFCSRNVQNGDNTNL